MKLNLFSKLMRKWKEIVLFFFTFLFIFLLGEVGFSTYYYHKRCSECKKYGLAWNQWIERTKHKLTRIKLKKIKRQLLSQEEIKNFDRLLHKDKEGKKLLNKLLKDYKYHLKLLVDEVNKLGSKMLILYIPLPAVINRPDKPDFFIDFVRSLAMDNQIDFIDLRDKFIQYSPRQTSLLPEDDHLSRFGNTLVAQTLAMHLQKYQNHRINFTFKKRPSLFGDLEPSSSKTWEHIPELPYLVTTNAQGLRADNNISFPKTRQRILFLGDSLTFGPYLPDVHTFPSILSTLSPDKEIINAGVFGYTISDEAHLFLDRAKYIEPDIVVLQVFSNDLHGLLWYMKNVFARNRDEHVYQPSELEKIIWEKVTNKPLSN